ncbi:MAG: glycosyltransferase family 1 protein [Methylococcus sp.]|nr:glycosyltransferase family 1 protein [Methylococcus sp.]
MRIVIDMQGAQTESRFRGIGRYTLSFAQAVVRNRGEHDIILALSGLFPDTIEPIRAAFDDLLPQENIRVWHAPGPVREGVAGNESSREVAELLREAFLNSLQPDVIHISSMFEGYVDDAVTSIGRFDQSTKVSVTLYDLIPLLNPDKYLNSNPDYAQHYLRKFAELKRAEIFLAISEFACQEGIDYLGIPEQKVVNVSAAIEPHFQPRTFNADTILQLRAKLGINRPFILCASSADEHKNLPRLVEAYAALPSILRDGHQLVFAGKMPVGNIELFRQLAESAGLRADELVFSGYISDEELLQLYNLCQLFVFPSWHEGFGLPALEAMACGAPVIGANTSSLPEVIGLDEALFDPHDVKAITAKLAQVLEDDDFRAGLRAHGLQQAKQFCWDRTAKRAISVWESLFTPKTMNYLGHSLSDIRLYEALAHSHAGENDMELAVLSDCLAKNQQNGIERQLLLDVSELCQRDAATGVQRVVRSYLKWLLQSPPTGFRVEPVYATREEGYRYARCFSQRFMGEDDALASDEPIRWQRGDIFFGLDMQHHVQLTYAKFYHRLQSEGVVVKFLVYDLLPIQLADLFKDSDAKELHEQWLAMIAATDGAICISKATADSVDDWIVEHAVPRAPTFRVNWVHIGADIDGSKPSKGMPDEAEAILAALRFRPTFVCVSTLEPRKQQQQILEATEQLWREGMDINLVFVGQKGWKIGALVERLRTHPEFGRYLFWLEGISDEYLEQVYAASTCLVAASLNEGFGLSLIEAARHGIPIIARDIPVFREVAGEHADYFQGETAQDLAVALKAWLEKYRAGQHPLSTGMPWSTWQQSTEKLKAVLVGDNYPRHQLLVDISELVQRDARTGIQRVVRSVLKEWLLNPPEGYRVEPVYATVDRGYRYARQFTQRFLGTNEGAWADEPIDYTPGDIFFGLDLQPQVQVAQRAFYQALRREGVWVKFLVHDLLCVQMPQYFPPGSAEVFAQWLEVVAENDGAVCVSETTAQQLGHWIKCNCPTTPHRFNIAWSHNGADITHSPLTQGLPPDTEATLAKYRARPTFLMVGTLEPRKGHVQVLDAFDRLWQSGADVNLAIVGKQGWMVEEVVERLRHHPEQNKRLFWLEGISDADLEKIYAASTCLIAASYGEGFGLPLIEAAQHKLPIIARDIPVFREVAGEHAYYFDATAPVNLAQSIHKWLELTSNKENTPRSDEMPWMTWKQSVVQLNKCLFSNGDINA